MLSFCGSRLAAPCIYDCMVGGMAGKTRLLVTNQLQFCRQRRHGAVHPGRPRGGGGHIPRAHQCAGRLRGDDVAG